MLAAMMATSCSRGISDGCGNDVSGVRSDVFGIDIATGEIRWTASVPAAEAIVVEDETHARAVSRWVKRDTIIDVTNGEVIGSTENSSRGGFVIDPKGSVGAFIWNDQTIPIAVDVGTTKIVTNSWGTPTSGEPLAIRAEDPSFTVLWTTVLADDIFSAGHPRPVVFGESVVTSVIVDPPSTEGCIKG